MHSLHQLSSLNDPIVYQIWGPQTLRGFLPPFAICLILFCFVFCFVFFLLSCFWVACVSNLTISYRILFMYWVSMSVLLCPVLYYPSILYKWQINEWTTSFNVRLRYFVWKVNGTFEFPHKVFYPYTEGMVLIQRWNYKSSKIEEFIRSKLIRLVIVGDKILCWRGGDS